MASTPNSDSKQKSGKDKKIPAPKETDPSNEDAAKQDGESGANPESENLSSDSNKATLNQSRQTSEEHKRVVPAPAPNPGNGEGNQSAGEKDQSSDEDLPPEKDFFRKLDELIAESEAEDLASGSTETKTNQPRQIFTEQNETVPYDAGLIYPGFLRYLNPINIFRTGFLLLVIVFGVMAIFALRKYDVLPLSSIFGSSEYSSKPSSKISELSRNHILITSYNGKLYYFDSDREGFFEVSVNEKGEPTEPARKGTAGVLPSIDVMINQSIVANSSQNSQTTNGGKPKIAIIVNKDNYQSGIYVMDFTKLEGPDFVSLWTKEPATGYSLKSHSVASWSPDGNVLAFVASKEGKSDLFIAEGKDKIKKVTQSGQNIGTIQWINSSHIAIVSDSEGRERVKIINTSCCDTYEINK